MRIKCRHGYFLFDELAPGQVSRFMGLFGLELAAAADGQITFADLVDAPEHSIAGGTYLGAPATQTLAGRPWDILRANGLIYNFNTGLVVPILAVTQKIQIKAAANFFLSSGLILPGSLTDEGTRVTDYAAFFSPDRMTFKYSEVGYG